jgi:hypothetical protein
MIEKIKRCKMKKAVLTVVNETGFNLSITKDTRVVITLDDLD